MAGMNNPPGTPRDDGEMAGNFLNPFQSESVSLHHTAILPHSSVTTCTLQIYLRSLYAIVSLNIGSWYNKQTILSVAQSHFVPPRSPSFLLVAVFTQHDDECVIASFLFCFYFIFLTRPPSHFLFSSSLLRSACCCCFFRSIINSPQLPQTRWAGAVAPFSRLTWPWSEGRPVQSRKKAGIGPSDRLSLPAGLHHWIGTLRAPEWTTVCVCLYMCVCVCGTVPGRHFITSCSSALRLVALFQPHFLFFFFFFFFCRQWNTETCGCFDCCVHFKKEKAKLVTLGAGMVSLQYICILLIILLL